LKPSKQFVFFAFRKHQIIIGEISILLFKLALLGWLAKLDQSQQWWIGDLWSYGDAKENARAWEYGAREAWVESPDWNGPSFGSVLVTTWSAPRGRRPWVW